MNKKKSINLLKQNVFSVYGLGNVGGPIAAAWIRAGATVVGVDVSLKLLDEINSGTSHQHEPFLSDTFTKALKNKKLTLTNDGISASKKSEIKIVAVPVALKKDKVDLSIIKSVVHNISKGLKKNDCVIICPSLPPGTTENILLPILEKNSSLKGERDFFLVYNPERIFEGRALQDIEENYPAIISGLGPKSLKFAEDLLKLISKKGVLKMSSLSSAEAEKLFEGVYRDVNIALANELSDYCERAKINFFEARAGANSQPFCHLHFPGTGVGGLCIPVYPKFVINNSIKLGKHLKILEQSRRINDSMPRKCVSDALKLLKNIRNIKRANVAVLGLGFRGEVSDTRLSPSYEVIKQFLKKGHRVSVHDPYVKNDPSLPKSVNLSSNLKLLTKNADIIFISTDHKQYSKINKSYLKNNSTVIYDGRNILNKIKLKNSIIRTIGIN